MEIRIFTDCFCWAGKIYLSSRYWTRMSKKSESFSVVFFFWQSLSSVGRVNFLDFFQPITVHTIYSELGQWEFLVILWTYYIVLCHKVSISSKIYQLSMNFCYSKHIFNVLNFYYRVYWSSTTDIFFYWVHRICKKSVQCLHSSA